MPHFGRVRCGNAAISMAHRAVEHSADALASERAYVGDGAIGSHTGHTAKWPDPDRGRDASYGATRRTVVGILDSNPRG